MKSKFLRFILLFKMGINGLNEFIKNKYPQVTKYDHISKFAFKRISLDVSPFIYRFMNVYGKEDNKWLRCFINLTILLKKNYVRFIPVFDGECPIEKKEEQLDRKITKNKKQDDIKLLEQDVIDYQVSGSVSDRLRKINNNFSPPKKKASLLHSLSNNDDPEINLERVMEYIQKQNNHIVNINKNDIENIKDIFRSFGVPYLQAHYESEQLCCALVNEGICDAVLSPDSDCIAYNSKIIINHLDTTDGTIKWLDTDVLREELNFSKQELQDFCILLGCDYNRTCKLKNVGPVKAFGLMQKFKSIEKIENFDIKNIKYEECRKIFSYTLEEDILEQLKEVENNVNFSIQDIKIFCEKFGLFVNYKLLHEINKLPMVFED